MRGAYLGIDCIHNTISMSIRCDEGMCILDPNYTLKAVSTLQGVKRFTVLTDFLNRLKFILTLSRFSE